MKKMEDEVRFERRKLGRELWEEKVILRGLPEGKGTRQEFLPSQVVDCWG
jgi:hypothetical protein